MGAIASGGIRVLNRRVVDHLGIDDRVIEQVAARERVELERRERNYRDDRPAVDVQGLTVILVDDGVATGSTMYAAISALRQKSAGRIIVAVPTIARTTYQEMSRVADKMIALLAPEEFYGVGRWYEDFSQTTDEEVRSLLARAAGPNQKMQHDHTE